ncbi:hypothetical protein PORUE0001_1305 [Porphyromonas uenonis 60-3]|uniref:Uncharacterized protein n=1 Tax=Porphyromonas uenonis 60-3 TaxID=596327 RepID=C2MCJ0_9PORP|nr:hypothetical protein PORUE0001_1305 [Porphyromonas uenonis 60-3]
MIRCQSSPHALTLESASISYTPSSVEGIYERTILGKDTNSLDTMKTFGAYQEHIMLAV